MYRRCTLASNHDRWAPLIVLIVACLGCDSTDRQAENDAITALVAARYEADLATKSREDILKMIEAAAADYEDTRKLYESSKAEFRRRNMQTRMEEQIAAWRELEARPDSTPDQQVEAISAQTTLLVRGAEAGWPGFDVQLAALRDRLVESSPDSKLAAHADAAVIWHSQLRQLGDAAQTSTLLDQHAAMYPESPTGPGLYARYAQLFLESGQLPEARQVCESAVKRFEKKELLQPVQAIAARIQSVEIAQQQHQAMMETRARQFGGHYDGYFVLFLRPKNLGHMSEVDYVVAHGLEEAIRVADNSEAWEMKGWFPETRSGAEKADQLADKLLRENTIEIMTFD